ncbi:MAG: hypothetical protein C0503_02160 [Gemmatimonas sp.]|nr:hypothetical protein [Gemmatimonas sp.]
MLYLPAMMHQPRRLIVALLSALALLGAPRPLDSHEIPERVALRAWALPRGDALVLLLRVPLESMRDLDFPERADGALDLERVRPLLDDAARTWLAPFVVLRADGRALDAPRVQAARIALPDDRSFDDAARATSTFAAAALGDSVSIPWRQAQFDVALVFTVPDADAALSLDLRLARLGVRTYSVLHLVDQDGEVRSLSYVGDPGSIPLDPRWWENLWRFLAEGFRHILGGIDHLLFVFCLVLPLRRWRPLVAIVTAFTVAHSITLGAAALGVLPTALWFPPLIEAAIAVSILWLAVENVLLPAARLEARWRTAFAFGLIHGFGFSFALREQLQFAGGDLFVALAAFNLGVEAGQLAVVAAALLALTALRRQLPEQRQHLIVWVGSAFVAHSAYHWTAERIADFAAHDVALAWPSFDGLLLLAILRAALVACIAIAAALGLRQLYDRLLRN